MNIFRYIYTSILVLWVFIYCTQPMQAAGNEAPRSYFEKMSSKELLDKARVYSTEQNLLDSALICYKLLAKRSSNPNLTAEEAEYIIKGANNLGLLYFGPLYDYQKAYDYLSQAKTLAMRFKNDEFALRIDLNISMLNITSDILRNDSRITDNVIKECLDSYKASVEYGDLQAAAHVMCDMLNFSVWGGKERESLQIIHDFRKQPSFVKVDLYNYILTACKGIEAYIANDYQSALKCFSELEALDPNSQSGYESVLTALMLQSQTQSKLKNYAEQEKLLIRALAEAKTQRNKLIITMLYSSLHDFYNNVQPKTEYASKYRMLYLEIKDTLLNLHNVEEMHNQMFTTKLEKVSGDVKELASKRRQQQRLIIILSVSIAIIILLLLLIFQRFYKLRKRNMELYEKSLDMLKTTCDMHQTTIADQARIAKLETQLSQTDEKSKYAGNTMSEDEMEELYQRILDVMELSDNIYNTDFNIQSFANLVGVKQWHVSQVINQKFGNNFKALLNSYRIKEACRRLNNTEHYQNYTIEAIAESLGFKSRSYFVTLFKNIIGITPSMYHKIALEKAAKAENATQVLYVNNK